MLYLKTLLGKLPRRGKLSITPHVSVGSHDNRQMRLGETRSRIPCVIIHWRHALFLLLLHYWERVHPGRRIWYCLMQPQTALRLSGVIESMCLRHIWVKNLVFIYLFRGCFGFAGGNNRVLSRLFFSVVARVVFRWQFCALGLKNDDILSLFLSHPTPLWIKNIVMISVCH